MKALLCRHKYIHFVLFVAWCKHDSPFLQKTKALRESRCIALLSFWTLALEGGEGLASHPGCFPVVYPGIFFGGGGCSTNSAEDRGQKEWVSGGGSPLVRGSTQFSNE
jgi:hypothetical protein